MPHSNSAHRQHKRDLMTARILQTAREIMREEGVAALSLQELARRLDLRAPSLYNYYSSKMDLYDALFRLGFTLFGQHMAAATLGAPGWQDELRLNFEGYMRFALQNPELYQLCFERPVPGFTPSAQSMQLSLNMLHQAYGRMAELLTAIDVGLNEQQTTDLLIAIMHGLAALHLANEPDLPVGEGRFGSLIPVVVTVLDQAWRKE